MQVMSFFLSNASTGGMTLVNEHKCHRSWGCCDTPQPTVTAIYVQGVSGLTVELRPTDEKHKLLCLRAQLWTQTSQDRLDDLVVLSRYKIIGFPCFCYPGDTGNTPLVDDGTPLGATTVVTPKSADCVHWRCCILASLLCGIPTSGTCHPQLML